MKKSCPTCGMLVDYDHECPKRQRIYKQPIADDRKIYATTKWNKLKSNVEREQDYTCLFSYYVIGTIRVCNAAHHIVTINDDVTQAFDKTNIISLDKNIHACVHELYKLDKTLMQRVLKDCIELHSKGLALEDIGMLKHKLTDEMLEVVAIYEKYPPI